MNEVSEATWKDDVINAKGLVLVDFWAQWCVPCRMVSSALNDIEKDLGDKVKIVKVDVEECFSLAKDYSIRSIPTLILFKDGKIVDTIIGASYNEAANKANILEKINAKI